MPGIQCQNCGIVFERAAQLQNHKAKFCISSKYGNIDSLDQNFGNLSKNKDISLYGKMSLAMNGQGFDFNTAKPTQNKNLDQEYRKILKQIQEQKNIKNRVENQRQKAFKELQALEKQEEQLLVEDKRKNLQDVIFRRQQLRRQQQQLQRQLKQYDKKKMGWEKSQVKVQEKRDHPFQQGMKIGKIQFQRNMLQEKKHNFQLELNGKRRQKERLQKQLLQMSDVDELKLSRISAQTKKSAKSNIVFKSSQVYKPQNQFQANNSYRNKFYEGNISKASSISSILNSGILNGNEKIYKFSLNKQGKSEQDLLLQQLRAQQYDDLQILSKLPKNSQLYNKKLKQYQQLSQQRMKVYQKAQRQRIQKMKRQYQYDKRINTRQRENSQWVDQNRKALMNEQINLLQQHQQANSNPQDPQYSQQLDPYLNQPDQAFESNLAKHQHRPSISDRLQNRQMPTKLQKEQIGTQRNKPQSNFSKKNKPNSNVGTSRPNMGSMPLSGINGLQSYPYGKAPKKQKTPQDNFGYRISILQLKNYSHKKAIKIKIIIYQEYYKKDESGMNYQFATVYHDETIDPNQPYNPSFQNKMNSYGEIAYHQSFYVPKNLQQLYNKNQKQIYLMLIAVEKDQKKITNEPLPYGWYNFKITHFGQLRQGRFTFNLYGDDIIFPIPADMNKMKKKKQQQLTIQVEQVLLDRHSMQQTNLNNSTSNQLYNQSADKLRPSIQINSNNSIPNNTQNLVQENMNGSKHNMNYPLIIKNKNKQNLQIDIIDEPYFHTNQKSTEFSHCHLRKSLNFDVSVAALRTLPSYIGPVKLQLSFIDIDNAHILPRQQFLAEISTDLYNPIVNYTRQIRNQTKIPPSTIIFIRMVALSSLDYQVYSLGFSLIYLFLDKDGDIILNNKIADYFMTSGYYQLPIFWGNIQPQYIPVQQLLSKYSPIPCSSILIGILQNASKISNPMPQYRQKVYNTILFRIDQNEAKLFKQQYQRQPIDTNTLISGYLQYKGIKKNYSGEQIRKYLYRSLTFSSETMKQKFELKWMAEYQQYFGMNFVIDKLTIPKTELSYYYFITVCLSPPAKYYKNKGFDLVLMKKINFQNSKIDQLQYTDSELYLNPSYDRNTCLIIEINRLQIFQSESTQADPNIQGFAYTIVPLFEIHEKIRSVNVQKAQIPLYQEDFDINNLGKIQKNLPGFMNGLKKKKKSNNSIYIRLLNGFYMNQYHKYKLDSKAPLYKTIQPENMSFNDAFQEVASILSNNYNLQIS